MVVSGGTDDGVGPSGVCTAFKQPETVKKASMVKQTICFRGNMCMLNYLTILYHY